MNIVFFGSSNFAVPSLEVLLTTQHRISCVITQPDKEKGRGLSLSSTAIKTTAIKYSLRIYQPDRINNPEAIRALKDLSPDLFVVVSYGQILSPAILNIPKIFSINLHASLLPKYRGAAPINWAIINGDTQTGLTIIKMNERMDAGEIILQREVSIDDIDTAVTLEKKLARQGTSLLLECLNKIESGTLELLPQDETQVSFSPELKKKDGLINWQSQALQILNLIRGTADWPGAFTYYNGKLLKIYKAKIAASLSKTIEFQPGEIIEVSKEGISVVTEKDNLIIEELQIEGGRRMKVEEFIAGHKIRPQEKLGS